MVSSLASAQPAATPLRHRVRRALRLTVVALISSSAALGCASFDTWQREAIFQNHAEPEAWSRLPDAGQEFDLVVGAAERVHGWYVPARDDAAPAERAARPSMRATGSGVGASGAARRRPVALDAAIAPGVVRRGAAPVDGPAPAISPAAIDGRAPTLLFLHGARHDLNGCAPRVDFWRSLGFNVLAVDYRGFGRSSLRVPSEATAIEDAQAALAELRRREPDPSRRFVYGYSLGGAMAIALAAQARDGELAGVIVESSFTRIADVVGESRWGWLPLPSMLVTQPFDSARRIAEVRAPLLFFHGTEDAIIPHTMSDRLAAAAVRVPAEAKRVVKIDGATHRSGWQVGGAALYGEAVRAFVDRSQRGFTPLATGLTADQPVD